MKSFANSLSLACSLRSMSFKSFIVGFGKRNTLSRQYIFFGVNFTKTESKTNRKESEESAKED
jgi:hypothetical protein